MAILYNDSVAYDQSGFSYLGDLVLVVPGLDSSIVLSNVKIFYTENIDYSNNSTIGLITVDNKPFGVIEFQQIDENSYSTIQSVRILAVGSNSTISIDSGNLDNNSASTIESSYVSSTGSGTTITINSIN